MADSWKTDGNCDECRRQKYCNKRCTKARKCLEAMVHEFVKQEMGGDLFNEVSRMNNLESYMRR